MTPYRIRKRVIADIEASLETAEVALEHAQDALMHCLRQKNLDKAIDDAHDVLDNIEDVVEDVSDAEAVLAKELERIRAGRVRSAR